MKRLRSFVTGGALLASLSLPLAGAALAQTGALDQVSPATNAGFNGSASSLTWQQQVRAGIPGQLEGFEMTFTGGVGAYCDLVLRVGDGWNVGPPAWVGSYTKTTGGTETPFIDVTSANINLAAGDTFVIELTGNDTGMGMSGSYVDPAVGAPLYPEELYLNITNPGCYADCGWRLAFRTWMVGGGGGGITVVCDPANNHTQGNYTKLDSSTLGAASAGQSGLHLEATDGPPGEFGYFLVSNGASANLAVSNGILCLDSPQGRYAPAEGMTRNSIGQFNPAGTYQSTIQTQQGWDVPDILPSTLGGAIGAGDVWYFQMWYRDGQRSNFSNAIRVQF